VFEGESSEEFFSRVEGLRKEVSIRALKERGDLR
jgi:hypothetical protein